jgi:aspartate aminotransferase-like enzyme
MSSTSEDAVSSHYRLRLPGPTPVPAEVQQAIAGTVVNHRGPEFHAMFADCQRRLKPIFGTQNGILIYAGSGTGVMEAALANILSPGDAVLIVIHGQFGERFREIATGMGAHVDTIEVAWGEAPDPALVEAKLKQRDYRAVLVTHNESSTGAVADLAAIGEVVRRTPALLVVDAVSGLAGIELRQDEWGLDIVVSASQKALMCPPGMGLVSVSEKAWAAIDRASSVPRFYWDFRKAKAALKDEESTFTPPVSLIAGLRAALRLIDAEGLPHVLARHARLGAAMRAGGAALGLPVFTKAARLSNSAAGLSNTVSVFTVPEGLDGGAIVRHLYKEHQTVIAGARNRLSGRVIRFGTMGHVSEADILADLHYLELTLRALGRAPKPGAGVAAASASLGQP